MYTYSPYTRPALENDLEFVTPLIAKTYLEGNLHNRVLRQKVVDKLMHIIRTNNWITNHQGICFDESGKLIDGQHRLYAIWLLGEEDSNFKGVWISVSRKAVVKSQSTIDIGIIRTAADIVSLERREHISSTAIATARMMAGGLRGRKAELKTMPDVINFVDTHYEAIMFTEKLFNNKNAKGVSAAGVRAVIGRAFYHLPHETLRRFVNVLIEGFMDRGEEAAIALRKHLKEGDSAYHTNSDSAAQLVYGRTERALEAFSRNKPLTKTPAPIKEELYMLPKEISDAQKAKREAADIKRKERAKEQVAALKKELAGKTISSPKVTPPVTLRINPRNPKGGKIKVVKKDGNRLAISATAKSSS